MPALFMEVDNVCTRFYMWLFYRYDGTYSLLYYFQEVIV